jgi:hypothetical protein
LKKDEPERRLPARTLLHIIVLVAIALLLAALWRFSMADSPDPASPQATATPLVSAGLERIRISASATPGPTLLNGSAPGASYPPPGSMATPPSYPGPANQQADAEPNPAGPAVTLAQAAELPAPYLGLWIEPEALAALPTCSIAWRNVKSAADHPTGTPKLRDQNDMSNVYVLAKALVYARTGEERYRDQVIANIQAAMGSEEGGRTLALSRNLVAYVIAADLVNLPASPEPDRQFRAWLVSLLDKELKEGGSLRSTHEERPNNWGTHAGASRAAVAVYLGYKDELARTAQVFRGWLGDRTAYAGFAYGRLTWQAEPEMPVGINPPGSSRDGYSIDGALPEEMRRGGALQWPPKETGYPWEAMQGAVVQAEILHRAGFPAWEWQDQALLRAARFLYEIGWEAEGDDEWQPWLINHVYGSNFPAAVPTRPGKNMGWTDWTHASAKSQPCLGSGDGG